MDSEKSATEILNAVLENYKPVPLGGTADLKMTTSEVWEKIEEIIPGAFTKANVAITLKEKGFTIVNDIDGFNSEWGFGLVHSA